MSWSSILCTGYLPILKAVNYFFLSSYFRGQLVEIFERVIQGMVVVWRIRRPTWTDTSRGRRAPAASKYASFFAPDDVSGGKEWTCFFYRILNFLDRTRWVVQKSSFVVAMSTFYIENSTGYWNKVIFFQTPSTGMTFSHRSRHFLPSIIKK